MAENKLFPALLGTSNWFDSYEYFQIFAEPQFAESLKVRDVSGGDVGFVFPSGICLCRASNYDH